MGASFTVDLLTDSGAGDLTACSLTDDFTATLPGDFTVVFSTSLTGDFTVVFTGSLDGFAASVDSAAAALELDFLLRLRLLLRLCEDGVVFAATAEVDPSLLSVLARAGDLLSKLAVGAIVAGTDFLCARGLDLGACLRALVDSGSTGDD